LKKIGRVSPHTQDALLKIFDGVEVKKVSHKSLKDLCYDAVAVIRTGEFTPYANVVLVSGVVF